MSIGKGSRPDLAARNHRNADHGMSNTPTFRTWCQMRWRCSVATHPDYQRYGARGISVCERWSDFNNFLADMGERPEGMTIDRINVDDNYEPTNCRWANPKEQARNRRSSRMLTFNGETKSLAEWAEYLCIERKCLQMRLKTWTLERALNEPYAPRAKRAA